MILGMESPMASWTTLPFYEGLRHVYFLWSCFRAHKFIFTAKAHTGCPFSLFSPWCPGIFPLEWLVYFRSNGFSASFRESRSLRAIRLIFPLLDTHFA